MVETKRILMTIGEAVALTIVLMLFSLFAITPWIAIAYLP